MPWLVRDEQHLVGHRAALCRDDGAHSLPVVQKGQGAVGSVHARDDVAQAHVCDDVSGAQLRQGRLHIPRGGVGGVGQPPHHLVPRGARVQARVLHPHVHGPVQQVLGKCVVRRPVRACRHVSRERRKGPAQGRRREGDPKSLGQRSCIDVLKYVVAQLVRQVRLDVVDGFQTAQRAVALQRGHCAAVRSLGVEGKLLHREQMLHGRNHHPPTPQRRKRRATSAPQCLDGPPPCAHKQHASRYGYLRQGECSADLCQFSSMANQLVSFHCHSQCQHPRGL